MPSDRTPSNSIQPRKSLGQNFLTDPNVARKIVGSLTAQAGDHVVEIGPGTGALTGELLARFARFTAIEIDQRAVALLQEQYPSLDVRRQDVLETGWTQLAEDKGGPLYVVGNLPYYLTSQILFSLFEGRTVIREAVVMMQYEVAERLLAVPKTKAYGILSVMTQLVARPELLFKVSRNVFFPKPDVTSAVVRLHFDPGGDRTGGVDGALLSRVVRTAFNQRRKQLRNSLSAWTREREIVLPHGWDNVRAEELTPDDFVELTRFLSTRSDA